MNPDQIIIKDRQRQTVEVDDQFVASVAKRLIHPIVLRKEENELNPVLVVGHRRLEALKKAGITDLEPNIHFRFFEDLSPVEAKIIELEENVKRSDLPWRDHVRSVGEIHELYTKTEQGWNRKKTGEAINITARQIDRLIMVYRNLNSPLIKDAVGSSQAFDILQIAAERRTAAIITEIQNTGTKIFNQPGKIDEPVYLPQNNTGSGSGDLPAPSGDPVPPVPNPPPAPEIPKPIPPVICANFVDWIKVYDGPKFNLIHVDFPYGIEYEGFSPSGKLTEKAGEVYENTPDLYFRLLNSFVENLDQFCSYSAHIIFWFSMDHYGTTKKLLESGKLVVHNHPLIWFKTDGRGIQPGAQTSLYPRRMYETAFLCSRGNRPLVKAGMDNIYGAPHASNPIHPSQKPEPMLRHFMTMVVDETTDVLDPTAGSGTALRAAEDCGARKIFGLELDPKFVESANLATSIARTKKRLAGS